MNHNAFLIYAKVGKLEVGIGGLIIGTGNWKEGSDIAILDSCEKLSLPLPVIVVVSQCKMIWYDILANWIPSNINRDREKVNLVAKRIFKLMRITLLLTVWLD